MNKIQQIRQQIKQGKRRSIFNLNLYTNSEYVPPAKKDKNETIESQSNFSLFPLLNIPEQTKTMRMPPNLDWSESHQFEKLQLQPIIKEKRPKKVENTLQESRRRVMKDSVQNVVSMIARACMPSVRISRVFDPKLTLASRTERTTCVQNKEPRVTSLKNRPKCSPSKPPTKIMRRSSRGKRTVSLLKLPGSPIRKFSISAWEIPLEQAEF